MIRTRLKNSNKTIRTRFVKKLARRIIAFEEFIIRKNINIPKCFPKFYEEIEDFKRQKEMQEEWIKKLDELCKKCPPKSLR